jgi:exodeoxyribonuclease X
MILLFDTETTGAGDDAEIIEAAYADLSTSAERPLVPSFSDVIVKRFKPSREIELGAMATHRIIASDLEHCDPSSSFSLPPETTYLIAHNVDFDYRVAGSPPGVRRICTLALSRFLWPKLDSHRLGPLIFSLMDHGAARTLTASAHSAAQDVTLLFTVISSICRQLSPTTWGHLHALSEEARVPTVMAFGKHKGARIADLPSSYQTWLLSQDTMDPYVKKAVRRARGEQP